MIKLYFNIGGYLQKIPNGDQIPSADLKRVEEAVVENVDKYESKGDRQRNLQHPGSFVGDFRQLASEQDKNEEDEVHECESHHPSEK